ncbi:MAG: SusC/RagA family TonB-linked outer membrane protein, partial [Bacteroidales bacterium]|nr:SusC/RagA family TonB-linked outer membrane protein [Bacteroidales bacterium]
NTDWWKEINRKQSWVQNYDLSVSGGIKGLSYFLSVGYMDQDGIDKMSSYSKLAVRLNTEYKVRKWLTIGESAGFIREWIKGGGDSGKTGFVASAINADPLFPVIDENKHDINPQNNYGCSELSNVKNPVAVQDRYIQGRNGSGKMSLVGNAYAQVNILDMIFVRSTFGFEIKRDDHNNFSPIYYLNVEDYNNEANAWKQFDRTDNINWLNTASFSRTFGNHSVNAVAGVQMELNRYEYLSGLKFGQPNNSMNFQWISSGVGGDETYGVGSESSLLSYFMRVNYNWHNRYLVSASVRRDGSSNFAPAHRWGTFPSVSAAWKISEEPFFRRLDAEFVDQIKIRAGWGQLGNQRISSDAYSTYVSGGIEKEFVFNGNDPSVGYGPSNAGNPDVSWERSESFNVGLDLNFFRNRLQLTADYYIKNTKGMLIQLPVSEIFGTFSPWENLGKVENKGWELTLDYEDAVKDFRWGANLNLSSYYNKVIDLGGALPYVDSVGDVGVSGFCRTVENMPIGYFYGYVTDGIFQTPAEVTSYRNGKGMLYQPKAEPGDFRFRDVNGDGVIDENDKTMIGSPHPDLILGFNLNFAYRNLDFSMSFSGVFGNEIFNAFKATTWQPVGYRNLCRDAITSAWTAGSGV